MYQLMPTDPAVLAAAVADTLVVATDPGAPESGVLCWQKARPWTQALVEAVNNVADFEIRELMEELMADPCDPRRYADLRAVLIQRFADPTLADLFKVAWRAEENSRVGLHVGPRYERVTGSPPSVESLLKRRPGPRLTTGVKPEVLIVIPFRDRDEAGRHRLRNLLACLQSLRDQSFPRNDYCVTVVECDDHPRWGELIEAYCDHYVFAPKPGPFNKSWAANVGVVNSPPKAEVVCICDADVLADWDFVRRNVERFRRPGTGGHLPYRDMFCMDPYATSWAISQRLEKGVPEVHADGLRGFLLRRTVGCCIWARAEVYHRIGGMDERYEGWGGEDNDLAYRLDLATPLDSFDDRLLHMYHPPNSELRDDGALVNAHIPPLTWMPAEPIGRWDRFAPSRTNFTPGYGPDVRCHPARTTRRQCAS